MPKKLKIEFYGILMNKSPENKKFLCFKSFFDPKFGEL